MFLKSHPYTKDVFWQFLMSAFMAKSEKEQEEKRTEREKKFKVKAKRSKTHRIFYKSRWI